MDGLLEVSIKMLDSDLIYMVPVRIARLYCTPTALTHLQGYLFRLQDSVNLDVDRKWLTSISKRFLSLQNLSAIDGLCQGLLCVCHQLSPSQVDKISADGQPKVVRGGT